MVNLLIATELGKGSTTFTFAVGFKGEICNLEIKPCPRDRAPGNCRRKLSNQRLSSLKATKESSGKEENVFVAQHYVRENQHKAIRFPETNFH